jgi:hypothetical protein
MLEVLRSTRAIQAARIGRIAVVLLMATSSSGCATLMQTFSAVQPTAALSEAESNTGSGASDEVMAESAATQVDSQWVTHVYKGWTGPSDM